MDLKTIPKSVCWDLLTITSISAPQSASSTYSRAKKEEIEEIAVSFRNTINEYPAIQLDTCTSKVDLRHLGILAGLCIDKELIERITGYPLLAKKNKNQRNVCNCIEKVST